MVSSSSLPLMTYDEIVQQQTSQTQSTALNLIDFSVGSILLALLQANAGNTLWLQGLISSLLAVTRLSTSAGVDVDSFIQQVSLFRNPATAATGTVTFSRATTTQATTVPVGAIVSVSPSVNAVGTQTVNNLTFVVTADTTNGNFNPVTNSYDIGIGIASIDVPVTCTTPGTIGNVSAGQINTLNTIILYVDTVTNGSPFTNGLNIQSDQSTKNSFVNYIQGLSRANKAGIDFAVSQTMIDTGEAVERFNSVENFDPSGGSHPGFFYVAIDNGSGSASSQLIAQAIANVQLYRGFTINFNVIGPTVISVAMSFTITLITNPTETQTQVTNNIQTALIAFINTVPFNTVLPYSRLLEVIYDSDPNIFNVTNLVVNGSDDDLTSTPTSIFITTVGTITVSYI
jgi:hypothetical protein